MKISPLVLAVVMAFCGCSYMPASMGGPAPATLSSTGMAPVNEAQRVSQNLGARVRSEIARAAGQGVDTRLALSYQMRGDANLQTDRFLEASEQYGRAEQALATSEMIAQEEMRQHSARTRQYGEASPPPAVAAVPAAPARHVASSPRRRALFMASKVRGDISRAQEDALDVSEAQAAQHAGDQALDTRRYREALKNYRTAEQRLASAHNATGATSSPQPPVTAPGP